MREEFVAALDPFLTDFPTHLETRFQLNLLNKDQAIDAIQKPAAIAGVEFTDGAANKLIDDLRVIKIKHPGEDVREEKGDYVEPLHLQLACNQIWEKLEPDQKLIVERQIQAVGEIDQALSNYYTTKVTELATDSQTRVDERVIRDWFETQLITSLGVRGQSLYLPGEISGSNPSQASEAGAGGTK